MGRKAFYVNPIADIYSVEIESLFPSGLSILHFLRRECRNRNDLARVIRVLLPEQYDFEWILGIIADFYIYSGLGKDEFPSPRCLSVTTLRSSCCSIWLSSGRGSK